MTTPANKPSRESLIALLVETGKSKEEIDFHLQVAGHSGLTPEEHKALPGSPAETAEKMKAALKKVQEAKAAAQPVEDAIDPDSEKPQKSLPKSTPKDQLLAITGQAKHSGKPVRKIDVMMTSTCYQIVDCMKVLDPKAYEEYRGIKYPGGVESLATDETKRKAYLFAFAFMYDHFKV